MSSYVRRKWFQLVCPSHTGIPDADYTALEDELERLRDDEKEKREKYEEIKNVLGPLEESVEKITGDVARLCKEVSDKNNELEKLVNEKQSREKEKKELLDEISLIEDEKKRDLNKDEDEVKQLKKQLKEYRIIMKHYEDTKDSRKIADIYKDGDKRTVAEIFKDIAKLIAAAENRIAILVKARKAEVDEIRKQLKETPEQDDTS